MTRLAEPSANVVFLPESERVDQRPTVQKCRDYLMRSVSVTSKRILFGMGLFRQDPPKGWQESGLLRRHRLLRIGPAGRVVDPGFRSMRIDRELGLVVEDEEHDGDI